MLEKVNQLSPRKSYGKVEVLTLKLTPGLNELNMIFVVWLLELSKKKLQ